MRIVLFMLILVALAGPALRAATIAEFDLDARNDFDLFEIPLDAGHYTVSLRNGAFTAWSNFDTTSEGCTDDCLQGWLNFFGVHNVQTNETVFVEDGLGTPSAEYDFNARLAYSTPEAALAAAAPFHFMLPSMATIQISIPDCLGCFIDNRGGLSLTVALVPEPNSMWLVVLVLASLGVKRIRLTP